MKPPTPLSAEQLHWERPRQVHWAAHTRRRHCATVLLGAQEHTECPVPGERSDNGRTLHHPVSMLLPCTHSLGAHITWGTGSGWPQWGHQFCCQRSQHQLLPAITALIHHLAARGQEHEDPRCPSPVQQSYTVFSDTALLLWPMIMVGKKRGVCTWNNCQKLHNLYLVPLRAG